MLNSIWIHRAQLNLGEVLVVTVVSVDNGIWLCQLNEWNNYPKSNWYKFLHEDMEKYFKRIEL